MARISVGDVVAPRVLTSILGRSFPVPGDTVVHLQFRRYAGCPVCNLHVREVAARVGELSAAGIQEVALFHSEPEVMREYQGQLPFDVVADPRLELYREFGIERISWRTAWRGLTPRSWRSAIRGLRAAPSLRGAMGEGENVLGLPGEFLIAPDGRVLAALYGRYIDDHWSVDDVLDLARSASAEADAGSLRERPAAARRRPLDGGPGRA